MQSHPIIWGVDIGHTSIKAVKLERSGDKVNVSGYSIEPIASGEDVDRDEAVVAALENIAQREDMMTVPVVISLSGRQIFSRTINIPVINKNKASKMVELEAKQQIPSDFSEVYWDYHLSPSVDGTSYDVALFAARQEIIHELIDKCKRANIHLVGISVTSLAVYNFVNYDQEFSPEEYIIVLDVGAENTDLCVYKGDTVWIRNLGVSGNDITRAFMKKFRVSFEEAETLKRQVGESRQAEKIFRVIEGSLGELISDVKRSLGFYKSQNEDASFENVVVSGNTFRLPSLSQFMADRLGYAIIELVELERIQVDPLVERGQFLEDLQSLGVAMGLALQGLGMAKADINLLPASLRIQGLLKAKRWAAIAVLVLVPLFYLVAYLHEKSQMQENLELVKDMYEVYVKELINRKQVQPLMNTFPDETRPVIQYKNYCKHKGVVHYVESSIFRAITDVRHTVSTERRDLLPLLDERDRKNYSPPGGGDEAGEDEAEAEAAGDAEGTDQAPVDPITDQEGADPILHAAYLRSISIPEQRNRSGVEIFLPLKEERTVTVFVRVPTEVAGPNPSDPDGVPLGRMDVNEAAIRDLLVEAFRQIPVSEDVFRNHYPDRPFPDEEGERPRLFTDVSNPSRRRGVKLIWYYMDPRKLDPVSGALAPRSQREREEEIDAVDYEFKLTLWRAQ